MMDKSDTTATLRLPDRLDMGSAPAIRERMLAASGDLTIDASDVRRLTSPGLQLLMTARKHFSETARALVLSNPSEELLSCLADLGAGPETISTRTAEAAA